MSNPYESRIGEAARRLDAGDANGALQLARQILTDANGPVPGVHLLRARAFDRLGSFLQALQAAEAELFGNPSDPAAQTLCQSLLERIPRGERRPLDRKWGTTLEQKYFDNFEGAAHRYSYRGIPMVKNSFDFALYPRLLHQLKPATIIEIGTFYGGSAIWFADLTRVFGVQSHVYSIDVVAFHLKEDERVTYLRGSGRDLGAVLSNDFLANLPRPLLVIEDADHEAVTTLAVLNFFHPILRGGEYIIVEDGMSCEGPRKALAEFFTTHGDAYEVDPDYCDFFGYNVTWCLNGWLRKR